MAVEDLATPALLVAAAELEHNLKTMAAARPGARLRPHVKAHKCTALAARQVQAGHRSFTCATPREVAGMAAAGLGDDLLLANEVLNEDRLRALAGLNARVTVAVDSEVTIEIAAAAGLREALIDVNVGLPRCGCPPEEAGRLAELARTRGLSVRGVMGYEGHAAAIGDRPARAEMTASAVELLSQAHAQVGGDVVSAGATGTYDLHPPTTTEIQAGSYALMDTQYARVDLPFRQAASVLATVISVSVHGYAVADCGLKSLGMDHGPPSLAGGGDVLIVSDEHLTFFPMGRVAIGDRILVLPAHVDPTVAYHERMHVVEDGRVLETWPVDLRGW
jgi:D-serine deaminase-like pyridoxal phosphate-dependent protein